MGLTQRQIIFLVSAPVILIIVSTQLSSSLLNIRHPQVDHGNFITGPVQTGPG